MHTANPSPTHETASTRTSGPLRVAIVGGGWAGLAAAVRATQAGHQVSVFEAAHQWGGRARTVTDGATYFHARSVRPGWSNRFVRTASIGHHVFYRPATQVASAD